MLVSSLIVNLHNSDDLVMIMISFKMFKTNQPTHPLTEQPTNQPTDNPTN